MTSHTQPFARAVASLVAEHDVTDVLAHFLAEGLRALLVAGQVRVKQGCTGLDSREGVEHRIELFVLDFDQAERLLGQVGILGGQGRHAVADKAHDLSGQDRHILQSTANQGRWDVLSGDHGVDACQRPSLLDVDPHDAGVRMGAA